MSFREEKSKVFSTLVGVLNTTKKAKYSDLGGVVFSSDDISETQNASSCCLHLAATQLLTVQQKKPKNCKAQWKSDYVTSSGPA